MEIDKKIDVDQGKKECDLGSGIIHTTVALLFVC